MTALNMNELPPLIQGGMGMGISHWHLARSVSSAGQLGVVSGTAIDTIMIRRLQQGDRGAYMREALNAFPDQAIAAAIIDQYYIPGGKKDDEAFRAAPLPQLELKGRRAELIIAANFCEIWLAKQGHDNPVGINLLDKIAIPNLASLFGAMLAGVDVVCMGAGIPHWVPDVLEALSNWQSCEINIPTISDSGNNSSIPQRFDPAEFRIPQQSMHKPLFLAIISSDVIGKSLLRRCDGRIDGFVIENHTAGGHNAPARSKDSDGNPVYSERDKPNLERIAALGRPFWLAGSCASPDKLAEAIAAGARGVQIGTPFAFCSDSGMADDVRGDVLACLSRGSLETVTDFKASPTGYPFKVLDLYENIQRNSSCNERHCDLGYLRTPVEDENGHLHYRCPAEPMQQYARKGGSDKDSEGKICLCNGLMASCGVPQVRDGIAEAPLITCGDNLDSVQELARIHENYSARDVINHVMTTAAVNS